MGYYRGMIAHLAGTVLAVGDSFIVIDVRGVGYKVHTTDDTLSQLSKQTGEVSLWTHLAVRENSLDLFGFTDKTEVSFFEMLLSVSGIGPRSALAILALERVETLVSAIAKGDASYLTRVSGIGKKSAEKIVIELRDKLIKHGGGNEDLHSEDADAIEALHSLGYSTKESREALKTLPKEIAGTEQRLTEALKILGNGKSR